MRTTTPLRRVLAFPYARLLVAFGALALILLIDFGLNHEGQPLYMRAMLDEPAHLLTGLIVLLALGCSPFTAYWWGVLASTVLIDLDHLPGYLGYTFLQHGVPRPYPHSLVTIALLYLSSHWLHGMRRQVACGAALGVAIHLFRDAAERGGDQIPLLWPVLTRGVSIPYAVYFLGLLALAVAGFLAGWFGRTALAPPSDKAR